MRLIDANKLQQRIIDEKDEIITDNHHAIGMHNGLTLAQAMIINAPTIEVPRWIPVTERLPEREDADRRGRVFVVGKNGEVSIANWQYVNWYPQKFTHWMPLPDAPKDGE